MRGRYWAAWHLWMLAMWIYLPIAAWWMVPGKVLFLATAAIGFTSCLWNALEARDGR